MWTEGCMCKLCINNPNQETGVEQHEDRETQGDQK